MSCRRCGRPRHNASTCENLGYERATESELAAERAKSPFVFRRIIETDRLTERQESCLRYVADTIVRRGFAPTLREIGEYMGIRSTNGVNDHLFLLEKKEMISRDALKARAIILTEIGWERVGGKGAFAAMNTASTLPATGFCDPPTLRCPSCHRTFFGGSFKQHKSCDPADIASVQLGAA